MRLSVLQFVGVTLVSLLLSSASAATVKRQSDVSDGLPTKVIAGLNGTAARSWYCFVQTSHDDQFCGGQLIAPDVVLTAAHCVFDDKTTLLKDASQFTVYCGLNDRSKSVLNTWPDKFNVTAVRPYPLYKGYETGGDLAMLKLDHATTTLKPIKLNTDLNVPADGQATNLIGFGQTALPKGTNFPDTLQYVAQPAFTDRKACAAAEGSDEIVSNQMCFGTASPSTNTTNTNPAQCYGDSGGPYFINDFEKAVLVAVVSWGVDCAQTTPGSYSIAELVAPYRAWIQQVLYEFAGVPACPALPLPPMAVPVGCDDVLFGGQCQLSCTSMQRTATCFCNNGRWTCEKLVCMPKKACHPWGCTCAGLAKKWLKTTFKEQPFETVFWQTYCQGNLKSVPFPSYGKPQKGHYRKPYPALPMPTY